MSKPNKPKYEVGYKRPPTASRFKPGRSGNPRGRPRGAKNFTTALAEELSATVAITEQGKKIKASKRDVIVKQMANKAAAGDHKMISIVLNESRRIEEEAGDEARFTTGLPDSEVMKNLILRFRNYVASDVGEIPPDRDFSEEGNSK